MSAQAAGSPAPVSLGWPDDPDTVAEAAATVAIPGVTEFAEPPGRGHSLTIDSGWTQVAQTALDFIKRFT
jgi:non-heme chloroperoxidase